MEKRAKTFLEENTTEHSKHFNIKASSWLTPALASPVSARSASHRGVYGLTFDPADWQTHLK